MRFRGDQPIVALTGGIDRLKTHAVQGSGDAIGVLGQDLLDGVRGIKLDGDGPD